MYHEEEATCAQGNDLQPPAGRRFNTNTSMDTNTKANTDDTNWIKQKAEILRFNGAPTNTHPINVVVVHKWFWNLLIIVWKFLIIIVQQMQHKKVDKSNVSDSV